MPRIRIENSMLLRAVVAQMVSDRIDRSHICQPGQFLHLGSNHCESWREPHTIIEAKA